MAPAFICTLPLVGVLVAETVLAVLDPVGEEVLELELTVLCGAEVPVPLATAPDVVLEAAVVATPVELLPPPAVVTVSPASSSHEG